jgi:site-specific recombinase XerD
VRTRAAAEADSLLAAYLEQLRVCRYSDSALRQTAHVLPRFFAHLKEQRVPELCAASEAHLVCFFHHLRECRLSWSSLHVFHRVLRGFFAFLEKRSLLLRNPVAGIRLPRERSLPSGVPSEREVARLLNAPLPFTLLGKRDRAILETLYGTGIRVGECARLEAGEVDLAEGWLWVRNGKGRRDRLVPLAGRARKALATYLSEVRPELVHDAREPALFLAQSGRRLAKITMQVMVRRYGQTVGLFVHAHALRHACATHLLRGGANVREVQRLLGHQHLHTTQVYTRVSVEDLRKAVQKAHPRRGRVGSPSSKRRRP